MGIHPRWVERTALAAVALAALAASPAHGTDVHSDDRQAEERRADDRIVKLIRLLISKGIVTDRQAGELLRESGPVPQTRHAARLAAPVRTPSADTDPSAAPDHDVMVNYVPQFVRKQIADDVRSQIMNETKEEGWAAPDALPAWTKRVTIYGDMRFRTEGDLFDSNNPRQIVRNYNQFLNFNSINNGSPFDDQSLTALAPFLNTTQDRDRFRVRARLGALVHIDDDVLTNFRLATGSDSGPITPNQTLGQPGDFSKYSVYIDRAYLQLDPMKNLSFIFGRMPNPYFTTDLLFYSELGLDGASVLYRQPVSDSLDVFATGGAYPIFNTAFDFSTFNAQKFRSTDSYLFAAQAGVTWRARPDLVAQFAVGLFNFNGVQGAVSKPCNNLLGDTTPPVYACDTDATRVPYDVFGNTLFPIRNIVQPPAQNGAATTLYDPQYYGLASRFNVFEVHPHLNILTYHPFDVSLEGEFIKNLGFNANAIEHHGPAVGLTSAGTSLGVGPVNNLGSTSSPAVPGPFVGGDTGYMAKATVGHLDIHRLWDWNAYFGYKYLQSDATIDSLTDPDFHLGGTNAQGFLVGGTFGIARDTFVNLRWFSAQTIAGPHYGNDVVQLDLQAGF